MAQGAPTKTLGPGTGGPRAYTQCDLCTKLGITANHSRDFCYVDPKGRHFKPEIKNRRVEQAKAKGLPIPPELMGTTKEVEPHFLTQLASLIGAVQAPADVPA